MLRFLWLFFVYCQISWCGQSLAQEDNSKPRIIALAPHLTELVYAIQAQDLLVGVDNSSDYPAEASNLAKVGDAFHINFEKIITLDPDVVLTWVGGTSQSTINRLQQLNINTIQIEIIALQDIAIAMKKIGEVTNREKLASSSAAKFLNEVEQLKIRYQRQNAIKVFVQVSSNPLYTLSGKHILSEVIDICGGVNLFKDSIIPSPLVSKEFVVIQDPDVIISGKSLNQDNVSAIWRNFSTIKIAKKSNLLQFPDELIYRPGLRILQGAKMICNALERIHYKNN